MSRTQDVSGGPAAGALVVVGRRVAAPRRRRRGLMRLDGLFEELLHDALEAFPAPMNMFAGGDAFAARDRLSIAERLEEVAFSPEDRDLVVSLLSICCHCRREDASLAATMHWYAMSGCTFTGVLETCGVYILKSTGKLVSAIAEEADADIRLETAVASIAQEEDHVVVITRDGQVHEASVAVAALPMNVLGSIEFSPALTPEAKAAIQLGASSSGVKVWIQLRGEIEPFNVTAPDGEPLNFIDTIVDLPGDEQIVVAFGNDAATLDPLDRDAVAAASSSELARRLPGIETPVLIIAGRHDRVVPLTNAAFLDERLPHSRVAIVDAGHFVWEEAPAQYAAPVGEWITGSTAGHTASHARAETT